jgi:hypothetical protein
MSHHVSRGFENRIDRDDDDDVMTVTNNVCARAATSRPNASPTGRAASRVNFATLIFTTFLPSSRASVAARIPFQGGIDAIECTKDARAHVDDKNVRILARIEIGNDQRRCRVRTRASVDAYMRRVVNDAMRLGKCVPREKRIDDAFRVRNQFSSASTPPASRESPRTDSRRRDLTLRILSYLHFCVRRRLHRR